MEFKTENLFLLEFVVDMVTLDGEKACAKENIPEKCVSFQFLDNKPVEVCETDFTPKSNYNSMCDSKKSGRSCLFSLIPEQVTRAIKDFDIAICVCKKDDSGCGGPTKTIVGNAIIPMANLFSGLIKGVQDSKGETPAAKTFKGNFDITDCSAKSVGQIKVYIRMSCFGKNIITEFQMNTDANCITFREKGGQSLYRYKQSCKKADDNKDDTEDDNKDDKKDKKNGKKDKKGDKKDDKKGKKDDKKNKKGGKKGNGKKQDNNKTPSPPEEPPMPPPNYNQGCPNTPCSSYGSGGMGGYGAPQGGYGAPQGGYGAPQGGYEAPQGGYGAPQAPCLRTGQTSAPCKQCGRSSNSGGCP